MQLRGDYNSTSAVNCAAKTIVTITAPPAAAASASALHLGGGGGRPSSVSTLTLASVPQSMLLEASLAGGVLKSGSVSAANTPLAPATKHTSFALTPSAMGPSTSSGSGHHVSFMPLPMMGIKRLRDSNSSLGSPTAPTSTTGAAATSSAPSLIEVAEEVAAAHQHAVLELRQSVQSQMTTLEDVDDVEHSDGDDDDDSESESVGMALVQTTPQLECRTEMASSSSSGSVK
ncbi:hypothetical protein KR093_007783 [Drosophila rubida]|uniref:Uncharacterized protein n=1 Tax=Drosophila rubida TaxID=30044 RepID=A0AAD4JUE2_9MUSC|nr:hypothetical protein KR093_007783 [Drosophila rubida]